MAESGVNLETALAAIGALRTTTEASLKQGTEILAEVRSVKEKVGEHAIALGQLQRDNQYLGQSVSALTAENKAQEARLRVVENRPEKPKVVDDDIKAVENDIRDLGQKIEKSKADFVAELTRVKEEIIKSQIWQRAIGWGINLIGAGAVAGIAEYLVHRH